MKGRTPASVAGGANLQSKSPKRLVMATKPGMRTFFTSQSMRAEKVLFPCKMIRRITFDWNCTQREYLTRAPVLTASAEGNYFNWTKLNNIVLGALLSFLILGFISLARRRDLYIRRIGGLEALDEALGRATEMGKPVLFIHGLRDMSQISTIAAVNILGRVARRTVCVRRCAWLLPIRRDVCSQKPCRLPILRPAARTLSTRSRFCRR